MNGKPDYPFRELLSDISCDYQRYRAYYGVGKSHNGFQRVRVFCRARALWAIVNHRFGYWVNTQLKGGYKNPLKILFKLLYFIGKYLSVCVVKIDISVASDIGPGLFLSNRGNIILGAEKMGINCTVHHNVTIGQGRDKKEPRIGDNVWIGQDSVLYSGIKIGKNTVIKGSTVLSKNIPEKYLIGGNPCRIIKKGIEDGPYNVDLKITEIYDA